MAARPVAQHAFLADALDSLQHSVDRLNHAHPNGKAYDTTPTTALFLPLISAPDAPRWQDVQASLMARFGLTKQSRVSGVDPGMLGTALVVSLLKKTVISDESLSGLACRAWIADLDAAVTFAEAECLRRAGAHPQFAAHQQQQHAVAVPKPSFFGSAAPPPATAASLAPPAFAPAVPQQPTPPIHVPPTPASTAPAHSSGQPFPPPAPSSSQRHTPAPLPPSLAALASQRRESGASVTFEQEEQDLKPFVPELHGAQRQQQQGPEQGQGQGEEEKDELEEPPEDEEGWDEQSSSMSHRASPSTASTPQQTQLGAALAALTQPSPYSALGFAPPAPAPGPVHAPAPTQQVAKRGGTGSGAPKPKRQRHAQFSGDETPPIELARAIFSYIRPFPDLDPLPLPPTWRSLNYSFKRRHLKGQLVWAINKGFREDLFVYRPSENYLALDPKNNWCGTKAHFDAPGHPIAFIGRKEKCDEAFKAISRGVHPDKQRDGIHVFISVPIHRWLARGFYVVAYDGSTDEAALKLPHGPGALDRLHPEMRRIFVAHATAKDAEQNKKTLHDWNFAANTYDEAVRELENGQGGQVMRFLLLKCIDFDQAAFDVWDAARRDPVQTGGRGPNTANAAAAQAAAGQHSPVQGPGPMAFV